VGDPDGDDPDEGDPDGDDPDDDPDGDRFAAETNERRSVSRSRQVARYGGPPTDVRHFVLVGV